MPIWRAPRCSPDPVAYTVPAGDAVALSLFGAYTAPVGDGVPLPLQDPEPPPPVPIRYLGASAAMPWGRRAPLPRAVRSRWRHAPLRTHAAAAAWQGAPAVVAAFRAAWGRVPVQRGAASARWGRAAPLLSPSVAMPWRLIPRVRAATGAAWQVPPVVAVGVSEPWATPQRRATAVKLPWGAPPVLQAGAVLGWTAPPEKTRRWWLPWRYAPPVRWVVHGPGVEPPIQPPRVGYVAPAGDAVNVDFICPLIAFSGDEVPVLLGPAACYWAWPRPRTYIVTNSVQVVRLPERTPIAVSSLSISSGVDDLFWGFQITLADPAHLALLQPDGDGPRAIEANVNGYVWTAIIEGYQRDRQFPGSRVSCTGRSQSALLDAPYAPARARVVDVDRQAQQLADDEVALTDFVVNWGIDTWLVTGGAWAYTRSTPAAAVRDIAAAAGAVARAHPWDMIIDVVPRYPVLPWAWTATAPDKSIPDDIILRDSLRPASRPLYNYVLVSGNQVGVADEIIRDGSSGDVRAEMVVDPLITTHAVAAARGASVLADRGEQAVITVEIPLFAPSAVGMPGLVLPMQLVEVIEPDSWKALAIGCDIRVDVAGDGHLSVTQTVTLERHYSDAN